MKEENELLILRCLKYLIKKNLDFGIMKDLDDRINELKGVSSKT